MRSIITSIKPNTLTGLTLLVLLSAFFTTTLLRAEENIFNICDFGAMGDGKTDDAPAFRKALAKAAESKAASTIVIPAGNYVLGRDKTTDGTRKLRDGIINIHNMKNITILGEKDTVLLFADPLSGFSISDCENITCKNLKVDYNPLPFIQGDVIAVDNKAGHFTITVDPGYASPLSDMFKKCSLHAVFLDPKTRRWDHALGEAYISPVTDLGDGKFLLKTRNSYSHKIPGSKAIFYSRRRAEGFYTQSSTNLLFEDITIYSTPGCGWLSWNNDGVTLRRCSIKPRPGTDRMFSTSADGFHCKLTRKPVVEYCDFSAMGDDSINIAGGYGRVCEQISDTELVIDSGYFGGKVGDTVEFFNLEDATVLTSRKLVKVENHTWRKARKALITLDKPFKVPATVASTKGMTNKLRGGLNWMKHLRELPVKPVMLSCMESSGEDALIRNCIFSNHRGRAIMMRGVNSRIENNLFEHLAGPAVVVGHDLGWGEGYNGKGAVITGNTFRGILRSNINIADAALASKSKKNPNPRSGYSITGVVIKNNLFEQYGAEAWSYGRGVIGNVINITDVDGTIITNNTIRHEIDNAIKAPTFKLDYCRNVIIRDNVINSDNNTFDISDKAIKTVMENNRVTHGKK